MPTSEEKRMLATLESLAWDAHRMTRWVKAGAVAMGLIAGMNFVSFLVDWWRALFGTGGTP